MTGTLKIRYMGDDGNLVEKIIDDVSMLMSGNDYALKKATCDEQLSYAKTLPEPSPGSVWQWDGISKVGGWINPAAPGATPAKWERANLREKTVWIDTEELPEVAKTTENQPIVDIMAITRGMCK